MADFQVTRVPADKDSPAALSGVLTMHKRMLGDAGAGANGKGAWLRTKAEKKTFFLYRTDKKTAISAAVVQIQGAMELAEAPDDPDADTVFKVIGTLNAASPSLTTEEFWPYMRAVVTAVDAAPNTQVGMYAHEPA